jgi:hypothetical protein
MITAHFHSVFTAQIKNSKPIGTQNLFSLINAIKSPDKSIVELIERVRSEEDKATRDYLKSKLNAYTPCVLVANYRRINEIINYSGLMALDFDKLESLEYSKEFRDYLFKEYKFIYASWLSSSGKGVRALVKIPRVRDKVEFRQYFEGLESEHMGGYIGFDTAPKNVVLALYQSHDPNLLYRETAETWTKKYITPPPKKIESYPLYRGTQEQERHVINIVNKAIDKITDNGHPQLRAIAFALGGYVGSGYIDYGVAISHINRLIESNAYLSQKHEVYKKTAQEMIESGQSKPLNLP